MIDTRRAPRGALYAWKSSPRYVPSMRPSSFPHRRYIQDILTELFEAGNLDSDPGIEGLTRFAVLLHTRLKANADNPSVAGFKSVVCYRTGLDVDVASSVPAAIEALRGAYGQFRLRANVPVRLKHKPLNDFVVRMALEVAAEHNKPGIPFFFSCDTS